MVADFHFLVQARGNKQARVARTKWWKLEGEASKVFKENVIKEGPWNDEGGNMRSEGCFRGAWSDQRERMRLERHSVVQKAIKEKECYKCLYHDRCADNIEKYKVAKKTAKRAMNESKGQAYEDLYQRLSTKEGENDIYRMARVRERKTRDFNKLSALKMKESISW